MSRTPTLRFATIALVVGLVVVPLVGCVSATPPLGGVPGTYTFRQPLTGFTYGPVKGTATICVTSTTALRVEQIDPRNPAYASVVFDGVTQASILTGPWLSNPVGPSCGQLTVAQGCCFFDPNGTSTITVSVTAA